MGRKNVLQPHKLVTAGNMSGNITSDPVNILYTDNVGLLLVAAGSPNGAITVEGTISEQQFIADATWVGLGTTVVPVMTVTTATNYIRNLNQLPYTHIRVVFTFSSGTGTLDVTVAAKSIGA